MAFTKITNQELNSRGATTLPNQPKISATALKQEFDAPAKNIVAPKVNNLIDELEATSAAASLGAVAPTGREGETVQAVMNDISGDLATVEGEISSVVAEAHTHANKALLDTYDQTNADITSAIAQKHTHSNKSLLDTYNQSNSDITSAIAMKHGHTNKSTLDKFGESSGQATYNGYTLATNAFKSVKVGSTTINASGSDAIELVAGDNVNLIPDASNKKVTIASTGGSGGGDMLASVYDDDSAVADAGGIADYVEASAIAKDGSNITTNDTVTLAGKFIVGNQYCEATGNYSMAQGTASKATNTGAHAEGGATNATGLYSHSEGEYTTASGRSSHAGGSYNTAGYANQTVVGTYNSNRSDTLFEVGSGSYSGGGKNAFMVHSNDAITVGNRLANSTVGSNSTSEGADNTASGVGSHAEGYSTTASGSFSHAEGNSTTASGSGAHAEGIGATASGDNAHAGGSFTTAGYNNQTVVGKYNDNKSGTLFEVGNGTASNAKANAFEVYANGDINFSGKMLNYLENSSVTLSTSAQTTVTFTNAKITPDSYIEYACTQWDLVPDDITVTTGSCVITLPKVDTAATVGVRIYVR